jgi:hypothetical protein
MGGGGDTDHFFMAFYKGEKVRMLDHNSTKKKVVASVYLTVIILGLYPFCLFLNSQYNVIAPHIHSFLAAKQMFSVCCPLVVCMIGGLQFPPLHRF